MTTKRRTTAGRALALTLAVLAAGCINAPPAPTACVDLASDSLHVPVRNPGPDTLQLPESRPDIGCCRRTGLTIGISDAAGRDLDRCGFADNFDLPRLVGVRAGQTILYRFSAKALSEMYCNVDLTRQYVSVHDGARSLGTQPLVPCGAHPPRG